MIIERLILIMWIVFLMSCANGGGGVFHSDDDE